MTDPPFPSLHKDRCIILQAVIDLHCLSHFNLSRRHSAQLNGPFLYPLVECAGVLDPPDSTCSFVSCSVPLWLVEGLCWLDVGDSAWGSVPARDGWRGDMIGKRNRLSDNARIGVEVSWRVGYVKTAGHVRRWTLETK